MRVMHIDSTKVCLAMAKSLRTEEVFVKSQSLK